MYVSERKKKSSPIHLTCKTRLLPNIKIKSNNKSTTKRRERQTSLHEIFTTALGRRHAPSQEEIIQAESRAGKQHREAVAFRSNPHKSFTYYATASLLYSHTHAQRTDTTTNQHSQSHPFSLSNPHDILDPPPSLEFLTTTYLRCRPLPQTIQGLYGGEPCTPRQTNLSIIHGHHRHPRGPNGG